MSTGHDHFSRMSPVELRVYNKIRRRMARASRNDVDVIELPLSTSSVILDQLEADGMYVEYKIDPVHGDYWEISW